MAASTSKRVFVYRFDRLPAEGVVNPASCFEAEQVEVMTLDGMVTGVSYRELKALCFVSESVQADLFKLNLFFTRRPKAQGLWTRFTFRDGSRLDGVLPHNLLEWPQNGYFVIPPHAGANRQRVFIPRLALSHTELRGVVGAATGPDEVPKQAIVVGEQLPMFE